jgi:hypothetical protein
MRLGVKIEFRDCIHVYFQLTFLSGAKQIQTNLHHLL